MTASMRVRLLALFVLLTAVFAVAQLDSARVQGTITDPTGASVVGAPVTITNVNTGRVVNTQSDDAGFYSMTGLTPGRYRIEVKQGNFKTYAQEFTLQVGQIAPLNVMLQTGQVTETVEVTSDIPLVESASSNISEVIVGRQVTELPLNGRNFTQLATLVPGVTRGAPQNQATGAGNQAETFRYGSAGGAALSVNGLRPQANNFLLDGVDNNESLVNTIIFFPPAEAIQEFRIDTSVAPAEYGRAGGGVINTSIKSGTNSVHGSAYWFHRNDNLDARRYFERVPQGVDAGDLDCSISPKPAGCKSEFKRNQFGGTLGGPIVKDKLFLFGDFHGWRQFLPLQLDRATVPTTKMRGGDFSELLPDTVIYDPITNQPFPGNIIPTDRLNPVAVNYLNAFPLPNASGFTQNYEATRTQIQEFNDFDIRADWNISQSSMLFGRFSYGDDDQTTSSRLPNLPAGFGSGAQVNQPRSIALGHSWVFSPTLVNEARLAWVRTRFGYEPPFQNEPISRNLGIPGANPSDLLGGGALIGGWNNQIEYTGDFGPYLVPQNTYQFSDSMSWTKGTHSVKFGAMILRRQVNLFRPNRGKGFFFLHGNGGAPYNPPVRLTGHEMSDLLVGFVENYQVGPVFGMFGTRNWETGYFVQDDWKVSRRLTLNLGLRYDLYTWPLEVQNRQANFNVQTGQIELATDDNRSFVPADKNNFAPRVGFAYDMFGSGKTVLRGGYGVFYFIDRGGIDNQLAQNPPYSGFSQFDFSNGYRVTLSGIGPLGTQGLLNPNAPAGPTNPIVCYTGCDSRQATGVLPVGDVNEVDLANPEDVTVFAMLPTNRNSYVQQWNLQIQQEMTNNMALRLAYVGTKGTKLSNYYNMNRPENVTGDQLWPNLGGVYVQDNNGNSIYHGLQSSLERRMTNGWQFLASYTWSHAIDDSWSAFDFDRNSGLADFRNPQNNRGNSLADLRHRFVFSSLIELPWGKGRRYATDMPSFAEAILGGWQINPIVTLQSGAPFDINTGGDRPFLVGDPQIGEGFSPADNNYMWLNPAAFATTGDVKVRRNQFYGPGIRNLDLALFKNFGITERINTQLRAEIFNLLNTPQFNNPAGRVGDGNFGRVDNTLLNTERQVQLGLRVTF